MDSNGFHFYFLFYAKPGVFQHHQQSNSIQFNSTQLIPIHILPNDHIRPRPRPQNIFSLVQSTCNLQISSKAASSGKRMTLDHSHCPRLCPIDRHDVVVVVPCPFTKTFVKMQRVWASLAGGTKVDVDMFLFKVGFDIFGFDCRYALTSLIRSPLTSGH